MTVKVTRVVENPFDDNRKKLKDFLWKDDVEPHAERRRQIMKAHPEVNKLMGVEPLSKYLAIGLVVTQFSVAVALRHQVGSLMWWLTVYFVGGTLTHSLFLGTHEIVHNLALRNNVLSKLLAIFTQLPIPIAYVIDFKTYHFEHHKLQGTEGVDTDLPMAWEGRFFSTPFRKAMYLAGILFSYTLRPLFVRPKEPTLWHLVNWACVIATHVFMYQTFGSGVFKYCIASVLISALNPCAGHFLAEHMVFYDDYETYSYYGWLNIFCWNVGYHNEHHDFPGVPWSKLPQLRIIAPEFYDNLPCHDSWSAVMYNFVVMDNISPFNRVKRRPKSN
uniref:Sphingolipid delta4-desaturase N-terminal domain-containing protein n=1 Tax=Lotharella globosa TaxID=91324 RepID=A0A6U3EFI9_9EUKA|mmetsp:Transcript_9912/g.19532  ORF Transcript_9912/g.19532 Transcript_9912/m.19532 type:complete len:331 (+) Transcript_9912:209-1201(+)|eukprot:CAMPEP_0167775804 /NCGR_PEP_ID=MMETSP0111_2-20121227/2763_1 /TAXON_ID=91324 /ORGANISM="Lotharella globosa, Strain CCCM811" /LENGTH=330 /DNA_ID=CAMNT_0007665761 /DNA_START=58 /DNA_END=1050 /DNA_ORIENTATION=+